MTYLIVLGVFAVCVSILAGQFVEVGKGKAPSLSLTVRALVLVVLGFCLVFFLGSALACDDVVVFDDSCDPGFTCSDEPEEPIVVLVDIFEEVE